MQKFTRHRIRNAIDCARSPVQDTIPSREEVCPARLHNLNINNTKHTYEKNTYYLACPDWGGDGRV